MSVHTQRPSARELGSESQGPVLGQHSPPQALGSDFLCLPLSPVCKPLLLGKREEMVHEVLCALKKTETSSEKLQTMLWADCSKEGACGQAGLLPIRSREGQWGQQNHSLRGLGQFDQVWRSKSLTGKEKDFVSHRAPCFPPF